MSGVLCGLDFGLLIPSSSPIRCEFLHSAVLCASVLLCTLWAALSAPCPAHAHAHAPKHAHTPGHGPESAVALVIAVAVAVAAAVTSLSMPLSAPLDREDKRVSYVSEDRSLYILVSRFAALLRTRPKGEVTFVTIPVPVPVPTPAPGPVSVPAPTPVPVPTPFSLDTAESVLCTVIISPSFLSLLFRL